MIKRMSKCRPIGFPRTSKRYKRILRKRLRFNRPLTEISSHLELQPEQKRRADLSGTCEVKCFHRMTLVECFISVWLWYIDS